MANPAVPSSYLLEWWLGDGSTASPPAESSPSPSSAPPPVAQEPGWFQQGLDATKDIFETGQNAAQKGVIGMTAISAGALLLTLAGAAVYFAPPSRRSRR